MVNEYNKRGGVWLGWSQRCGHGAWGLRLGSTPSLDNQSTTYNTKISEQTHKIRIPKTNIHLEGKKGVPEV